MLEFLTAGESHGKYLLAILEGMVAGLRLDGKAINQQLRRRQQGPGRGGRMAIERDRAEIISGLRRGVTLGSPIALLIKNRDCSIERLSSVSCPRPGHADLAGSIKYGFSDARNVLERASARETAARTAVGAVCRVFLKEFDIKIASRVVSLGGEGSPAKIKAAIARARRAKDTLGGVLEVTAVNLPVGMGSYVHYDRRLDGRLAQAVMSIPAIKGVEIGRGFGLADIAGSQAHDAIFYQSGKGYFRKTNNAGGLEGGVTNGQPLVVRAAMKPISTLGNPLPSVNMLSKRPSRAAVERYDTAAVAAAAVVAEAVVAFELCRAFLEKFGGDSLNNTRAAYKNYVGKR
ncbi:MAG: chorismate synthase [Candidatus Omnitrophota bacterium]